MRWASGSTLALLCACAAPPAPDWLGPRPVREVERWEVRSGERPLGVMMLLEIDCEGGPVPFYQVQNAHGQWLGYVDVTGRVYQRVPFSMTEIFRGIQPMERALALLYEEPGPLSVAAAGAAALPVEAVARSGR